MKAFYCMLRFVVLTNNTVLFLLCRGYMLFGANHMINYAADDGASGGELAKKEGAGNAAVVAFTTKIPGMYNALHINSNNGDINVNTVMPYYSERTVERGDSFLEAKYNVFKNDNDVCIASICDLPNTTDVERQNNLFTGAVLAIAGDLGASSASREPDGSINIEVPYTDSDQDAGNIKRLAAMAQHPASVNSVIQKSIVKRGNKQFIHLNIPHPSTGEQQDAGKKLSDALLSLYIAATPEERISEWVGGKGDWLVARAGRVDFLRNGRMNAARRVSVLNIANTGATIGILLGAGGYSVTVPQSTSATVLGAAMAVGGAGALLSVPYAAVMKFLGNRKRNRAMSKSNSKMQALIAKGKSVNVTLASGKEGAKGVGDGDKYAHKGNATIPIAQSYCDDYAGLAGHTHGSSQDSRVGGKLHNDASATMDDSAKSEASSKHVSTDYTHEVAKLKKLAANVNALKSASQLKGVGAGDSDHDHHGVTAVHAPDVGEGAVSTGSHVDQLNRERQHNGGKQTGGRS